MTTRQVIVALRKQHAKTVTAHAEAQALFRRTGDRFTASDCTKKEEAEHGKSISRYYDTLYARNRALHELDLVEKAYAIRKRVETEIRDRAYAISLSETAGTELENWVRAEREIYGD